MKKTKITIKGVFRFIRQMIVSLLLLVVFGGIGIYIAYNSVYGNPDDTLTLLYDNFESNNWKLIYEMSDVEEGDFVNYYTYAYVMNSLLEDVDKTTMVRGETSINGKEVVLDVLYGEGQGKTYSLTLVEDEVEKNHKFFPVWKLDLEEKIVKDVTIKVPFGYNVELDGINLICCDSTWIGEERMIEYHIDRIFAGTHTLEATQIGKEDILLNISFNNDGAACEVSKKEIKHEAILLENTVAVVFGLYKNALTNVGPDDLKKYFKEEQQEPFQALYDELYSKINQENGAVLKTLEVENYDIYSGKITGTSVQMVIDFDCNFTAKSGRTSTSGLRKDYSGTASSSVKVTYEYIDDTFLISDIEFECIDYSEKQ